ncbi:MAG: 16S rRNA (uracil(1498)-N(3))-methyltransferase [Prevotella sp.]|jgi:16S rRNA (uracil1498-N3)-methyltransferase|nr:16S rRNA (uracil(1498)-N(3))-methyltransferase [Prevotella sp.]
MEQTLFFAPDILQHPELPEGEAAHCLRVLRKKEGDNIFITDGRGHFFDATLVLAASKRCFVEINRTIDAPKQWPFRVEIAFAPTKNSDRIEWFAEKATEIGIDCFSPLLCQHSERKEIKPERIEKILVAAMKQSQKAWLPEFREMQPFSAFVKQPFDGQMFIAHCEKGQKQLLKNACAKGGNVLVLIGPEGDFSPQEIEEALANGFIPASLGDSRLRTETAALVACHTIHVLNQ